MGGKGRIIDVGKVGGGENIIKACEILKKGIYKYVISHIQFPLYLVNLAL